MELTSILPVAVYVIICSLIWISFRSMKEETIQKFTQLSDDNFTEF